MALGKSCPGSERFKSPTVDYVPCPNCGAEVEFWSVDAEVECHVCKTTISREQPPSCIQWCSVAEKCLGEGKLARFAYLLKKDGGK